jgi:hypothetical protein
MLLILKQSTMRTLKQFMLLVMTMSLVSLSSCSKDDDGGSGGNAAAGTITAKIDGSQFTSLEITSFANLTTASGQTTLVMQGNTQSQAINMIINGYNGVSFFGSIPTKPSFVAATRTPPIVRVISLMLAPKL